jgi:hypothetical protein
MAILNGTYLNLPIKGALGIATQKYKVNPNPKYIFSDVSH